MELVVRRAAASGAAPDPMRRETNVSSSSGADEGWSVTAVRNGAGASFQVAHPQVQVPAVVVQPAKLESALPGLPGAKLSQRDTYHNAAFDYYDDSSTRRVVEVLPRLAAQGDAWAVAATQAGVEAGRGVPFTGMHNAREEVFLRRAQLAKEMEALGLPSAVDGEHAAPSNHTQQHCLQHFCLLGIM
jgi:hypothetical protein